ncbi:MAG TPA: ATP-binding protein [bacterium]|nr:ATP-binding protein [bacterium]
MRNPFSFGVAVTGESFCNRTQEMIDLRKAIDSSRKLFIYGERRLGKTSLLKKVVFSLPQDEYISVYIDVWKCITEDDFTRSCASAFTMAYETGTDKILQMAKNLFGSFSPSVTIDSEGKPVLTFGMIPKTLKNTALEEVLSIPAKIADKYPEKQVVVIFDEFPQIRSFESDRAERVLRSVIQNHEDIAYFFCGSRKHIIREMFTNKSSPLYRSAAHYPIGYISLDHWNPFIKNQFSNGGKSITDQCVAEIFKKTEGHPFYTQMLCSLCFELCEKNEIAESSIVEEALEILMQREQHAFMSEWENLSASDKKLMLAFAKEKQIISPYSSVIIEKYGLPAASTVQRIIKKLMEKDIIDFNEEGGYFIVDKFLSAWILKKQSA